MRMDRLTIIRSYKGARLHERSPQGREESARCCVDLTPREREVLGILAGHQVTVCELASRLGLKPSTTSKIVANLRLRGLVGAGRQRHPVALTDAGRKEAGK